MQLFITFVVMFKVNNTPEIVIFYFFIIFQGKLNGTNRMCRFSFSTYMGIKSFNNAALIDFPNVIELISSYREINHFALV